MELIDSPREFTNRLAELGIVLGRDTWRNSTEWKFFVAGYNAAVKASNQAVLEKYNISQTEERLFGEKR